MKRQEKTIRARRKLSLVLCACLLLVGGFAGCGVFSSERRYALDGKVVSVDRQHHQATISHGDIKGYMPGMTMPFTIKEDWALGVLRPGDRVSATLVVSETSTWLENVVITSEGTGQADAGGTQGAAEPQPGDEVPDFTLVNQDGQKISLRQYRGRALVLTFIYTRCPLPDYCVLMSNNFAELDRLLRPDAALYDRTHLLSVSFDSEHDRPEVLKLYGQAYSDRRAEERFDHWEFASGSSDEVRAITTFFGLRYWPDSDQIVHSLRTAVVKPDGRLYKLYHGNDWKPADILADLQAMSKN